MNNNPQMEEWSSKMSSTRRRLPALSTWLGSHRLRATVPALLLTLGVLAGCGSSSSSSGTASQAAGGSTSSSSASSGVDRAKTFLAQMTANHVNVSDPIKAKIPTGISVDWISCGYQTCATLASDAADAGKQLGWNVKFVDAGLTPAAWQQAAATVVRAKPDYAVVAGIDASVIRAQVAQMTKEGVKVLGFATTPVPGFIGMVRPARWNINYGKAAAAYIIANSGQKNPIIGFANTTEFTANRQNALGIHEAIKEFCPGCQYKQVEIPATAPGKDAAQLVLNYLRGNQDVHWMILATDGIALGLPSALDSAGIGKSTKLVSLFPSSVSIPLLKNGQMNAVLATNDAASSWDTIDALARIAAGDSAAQPTAATAVPLALVTPSNVAAALPAGPGNWRSQFLSLWGK
ncbi:MAG: sugar ABC transporter substrate-binding protein [Sciscionella sp.]